MKTTHKILILVGSFILALVVWFFPLDANLPLVAQKALALILLAVLWWVFKIIPQAYTALLLVAAFILFGLASPAVTLGLWTRPLMWMILCSFLLATAVTKSGLARRVAYFFMARFATSYARTVGLIYLLAFGLSFLIPQPFPRALLIMAVVRQMIEFSGCQRKTAIALGFAVFSAHTATSMFLLTGDVLLNMATLGFAGVQVSWLEWSGYMAVPALAASLLMLGLHFLVFGLRHKFHLDLSKLRQEGAALGKLSRPEKTTLVWMGAALLLWAGDSLTHIDPAWVAVGAVVGLALPYVGEVLEAKDLSSGIAWPIVLFITGAFAVGAVSTETGLSAWLASRLLPVNPPTNAFGFAALVSAATMGVHMVVGSALATLSVVAPVMVPYAVALGWSPLFCALIIYTTVLNHYLLPFHNVLILLGDGETGGYSSAETLRYGIPLTAIVWLVILGVEVPWWMLTGLV